MTPKIVLYGVEPSPGVRAVLFTLKALNLDYVVKEVNPFNGETKTPEFLKMNPQHTIPTLEDDGKYIWDSHAINAYLVRKYGKEHNELYPDDFFRRAVVDQRLHYDNGVLFASTLRQTMGPITQEVVDKQKFEEILKNVHEAYDMLEAFLADNQYFAGNNLTIADFSITASVSTLAIVAPIESGRHAKLAAWFRRIEELPYFEAANKGVEAISERIKPKLEQFQ